MRKTLCGLAALLGTAAAQAAPVWVDWVSASTGLAVGSLGWTSVTLAPATTNDAVGIINAGASAVTGSYTGFDSPAHTPALPGSDALVLRGTSSAPIYTVTFGEAVLNPIIHLASLASELIFYNADGAISVTEISDDGRLTTVGNRVAGSAAGSTDANGTIQLMGSFLSFSWSATFAGAEEYNIQIGATAADPPVTGVPEPGALVLASMGLGLLGLKRARRRG